MVLLPGRTNFEFWRFFNEVWKKVGTFWKGTALIGNPLKRVIKGGFIGFPNYGFYYLRIFWDNFLRFNLFGFYPGYGI